MIGAEISSRGNEPKLLPVCSSRSPTELAVILSLLKSEGIFYHVFNDHFGSLHVGPIIPLYNEKLVLVREFDLEDARALVTPLDTHESEKAENGFTSFDKFRMAIEVLVFGWIIPLAGRFREKSDG